MGRNLYKPRFFERDVLVLIIAIAVFAAIAVGFFAVDLGLGPIQVP